MAPVLAVGRAGYFYPRSPCGERPIGPPFVTLFSGFLSTLSLRRATTRETTSIKPILDFYPRSPCGERLFGFARLAAGFNFYPRSPCGERRPVLAGMASRAYFYPRSPCGERPRRALGFVDPDISIHALLAESDNLHPGYRALIHYFYPRSPCGERLINNVIDGINKIFLSTLSLRRATVSTTIITICIAPFLSTLSLRRATDVIAVMTDAQSISIHALLAESDAPSRHPCPRSSNFYPRSPCGERRHKKI